MFRELLVRLGVGNVVAILCEGAAANYGGNHATGFEFAGVRGYEATEIFGGIFGIALMNPLVSCFLRKEGALGAIAAEAAVSVLAGCAALVLLSHVGAEWYRTISTALICVPMIRPRGQGHPT